MKIGILTFHWATNYGAVLQCYALQEYLKDQGHIVEIINYKPLKYDFRFKYLRRPWLIKNLHKDLIAKKKEKKLMLFRDKMLAQTKRYYSSNELYKINFNYDMVISGSDQVLNPSFTLHGEDHPTSVYYLEPFHKSKCIGYAISFGCNEYPVDALSYSKQWIHNFDRIGIRENSGFSVLEQMGYKGYSKIVPDPTILLGTRLFRDIKMEYPNKTNYLCVYMLRKHIDLDREDIIYVDDNNNPLSMEQWIGIIQKSKGLITNSYHGMIIAILNHVPFVALADANHMNNRFETLLSKINMTDNMVSDISDYKSILDRHIDWSNVDNKLAEYRKEGEDLLNCI